MYVLTEDNFSPLQIKGIPVLLYTNDKAVLLQALRGLHLLPHFSSYCNSQYMVLNYKKAKVMIFWMIPPHIGLKTENHLAEQVFAFTYLGIKFHHSGCWSPYHKGLNKRSLPLLKVCSVLHTHMVGTEQPQC